MGILIALIYFFLRDLSLVSIHIYFIYLILRYIRNAACLEYSPFDSQVFIAINL